ncbi:MAG: sugar phosphate isomerase/epimerase [Candidatus Latescibacteria bacterium]|nr:sugar phosphate isomerase/epimerase [Candidatus Latescibacterota bacterium]
MKKLSRRQALITGAASSGLILGAACDSSQQKQQSAGGAGSTPGEKGPGREAFWEPGPNKNLVRDLTPGTTSIRLGTGMGRQENESLTEMVKRIKDSGNTGVVTGPEPWISMKDSELNELRAALKKYDIVVYEVGGYTNMIHPDMAERQKNLKKLATCIEAADKIGCPMVGTISGSLDPVNFFNVHPDNWTKETWDMLVKSMKQVLSDTAGMKAAIGMEAQVTTNIDGPIAHKRLIEDVGDPRSAVNLDPVNMCSLANYYHTTELLEECFDLLGESILGCHAKDTYIWPDKQTVHVQEVCSGRGVMDYETYLVRMSRLKWPRTLLPEHVPGDQLIEAAEYIRKVAAKVGVTIHS